MLSNFCDKRTQTWYGKRIKDFQDVKLGGFKMESIIFHLMYNLQVYSVSSNTAHPATSNQINGILEANFLT